MLHPQDHQQKMLDIAYDQQVDAEVERRMDSTIDKYRILAAVLDEKRETELESHTAYGASAKRTKATYTSGPGGTSAGLTAGGSNAADAPATTAGLIAVAAAPTAAAASSLAATATQEASDTGEK